MSDILDVRDLIGCPFKARGRDGTGYDCWGLAMEVHRRRGVILPEFAYSESMEITVLHELITENKNLILELDRPEPYCLVGFSIIPGYEHHVGTVLEDGRRFIHIRRRQQVIISRLNDIVWKRRVRGFYRWIG